ncbi:MAG: hypothetical protein OHK93_005983 [Ramalina farinacea]|uniref:MAGE domain-containing protein n=1 Tax=Ramalina farinacea TaxID=258253 RepID=A0AA43TWD4_9LECA|nr:hypothetical protein [Ramalina farinacea]
MPVINRKRRADTQPSGSQPPRRRRSSPPSSTSSPPGSDSDEGNPTNNQDQPIKKLIRLALSSEYSRTPLRRSDISTKCMPPNSGRQFKPLLDAANEQLRAVFGMELTPLPGREKLTVAAKRVAARNSATQSNNNNTQATQSGAGANAAYILTSTLSSRYRSPAILPPAQIPSAGAEGGYMGFVTFVLALIYLSPMQTLSETRLEKHLKRVNAEEYVLLERTEQVVKRMVREGYVVKVKERENGGEETVDYVPGPRGKVEVGEVGVAGMARRVYGKKDQEREELERRLVRSLGEGVKPRKLVAREEEEGDGEEGGEEDAQGNANGDAEEGVVPRRGRGRQSANGRQSSTRQSTRRGREEEADEEEEEEEEEEDDDDEDEEEEEE